MCGITGFFNFKDAETKAKQAIQTIMYRGLDGSGSYSDSECAVCHCLHSVVSKVVQPLKNEDFVFLTNCEIYNWKELKEDARNDAEALFSHIASSNDLDEALKQADGVYSFALWNKKQNILFLARDLLGEKPLWYYHEPTTGSFAFASERKALLSQGLEKAFIRELNPRKLLVYYISTGRLSEVERDFFETGESDEPDEQIIEATTKLLNEAIQKRIPDKKIGLLFSGGIDSTFIALKLKQMGVPFTCYTAALQEEGLKEPEDLEWAKSAAKDLGFDLKIKSISLNEVPKYLKRILPLIEDNNAVKAGVALPFYLAAEQAKEDGIKVMFSGLGSEEIFAGYDRHKKSLKINEECISGLRKIYERDLYRDDVIMMSQNIELRLPFLDTRLAEHSLMIPERLKLNENENKIILRRIAEKEGMPKKYFERKKKAAQYGSNFDKALEKLSKKENKNKSSYLKQFYDEGNVRIAALVSTGKDSLLAAQILKEQNYDIVCFLTIDSENKDSYMYHGPNTHLAELQAEAAGVPLLRQKTKGEKEEELKELKTLIQKAIEQYKIEGITTGALFSNYQRERIEKICDELGIKCFSPLWHMDQEKEMDLLLKKNFKFILVKIAADGLDASWLGKEITQEEITKLKSLNKKNGLNIAGEGGEYESLVLDAPFFNKSIKLLKTSITSETTTEATLNVEEATLEDK